VSQQEFSQEVLESLELRYSMLSGVNQDEEVAEILRQKMIYFGILNTSQHIIDMMKSMLELFGTR
jgi:flagellar hook-associated protein FlgK